jgi:hypothetical protein
LFWLRNDERQDKRVAGLSKRDLSFRGSSVPVHREYRYAFIGVVSSARSRSTRL